MAAKLTKKQILAEIKKCSQDPKYFTKNYVKIIHPTKALIPFHTYEYQEQLYDIYQNNRFVIILKARQLGISTITASYILWNMLFTRGKTVLIVATQYKVAANLVLKVKDMYSTLPEWLKIASITADNKTTFELSNKSRCYPSSKSSDVGRSYAASLVVVDEAAHVEDFESTWTSLYSTLQEGGECIALSTPNGAQGWFYEKYTEATEGKNDFCPVYLPWDIHPHHDQEWFEEQARNMNGPRHVAQELECEFLASGGSFVDAEVIDRITQEVEEPFYRKGIGNNIWIWEEARRSHGYLIAADVARGDGTDFSTFHVLDLDTKEVVAEFQEKLKPEMFASLLVTIGREYNDALIVVENNTYGWTVLESIQENYDYKNLYWHEKGTQEYIEHNLAIFNDKAVCGITTSQNTRLAMLEKMNAYLRKNEIKVKSERLLKEFNNFIWKNNKPQASGKNNDDLVLAFAFLCWVVDTALINYARRAEVSSALLSNIYVNRQIVNASRHGIQNSMEKEKKRHKDNMKNFAWIYKG